LFAFFDSLLLPLKGSTINAAMRTYGSAYGIIGSKILIAAGQGPGAVRNQVFEILDPLGTFFFLLIFVIFVSSCVFAFLSGVEILSFFSSLPLLQAPFVCFVLSCQGSTAGISFTTNALRILVKTAPPVLTEQMASLVCVPAGILAFSANRTPMSALPIRARTARPVRTRLTASLVPVPLAFLGPYVRPTSTNAPPILARTARPVWMD
jgi:hypothetical protein